MAEDIPRARARRIAAHRSGYARHHRGRRARTAVCCRAIRGSKREDAGRLAARVGHRRSRRRRPACVAGRRGDGWLGRARRKKSCERSCCADRSQRPGWPSCSGVCPVRLTRMTETLEALLQEGRTFPPPKSFAKDALITDASIYDDAERDWQGFWAKQALALDWRKEWHTILDWERPFAKWYIGGTLNVSENCLDRHVNAGHGAQVAFHWEGEPGDTRAVTYKDLLDET